VTRGGFRYAPPIIVRLATISVRLEIRSLEGRVVFLAPTAAIRGVNAFGRFRACTRLTAPIFVSHTCSHR
jgi:hypothetical protein